MMIIAVLLVLGICLGSFVNALVWRLREQSLPPKKRAAPLKELSISTGRSMCPRCKHTLHALDLIPVVSWLALRGRCRYCKEPIGWQYPLVEISTAAFFVLSYYFWPFELDAKGVVLLGSWLIALVILMALLIYDARWMLLPNKLTYPFIALGALQVLVVAFVFNGGISYLGSAVVSLAVAGGIFFLLFQISKGAWIGGGDVKLGYGLGLFLANPLLAFMVLFTASLLGLLSAVPALLSRRLRATSRIPFGPFLILGFVIVMLFGGPVVDWYTNDVLLLP